MIGDTLKRLSEITCPECGASLDHALGPKDLEPTPGCIAMCMFCTSVCRLDDRMQMVLCTLQEIAEFPHELRMDIVRARREYRSRSSER